MYGIGCDPKVKYYSPGLYAKITREVTSWIKSVASGTQDSDCDKEDLCEDCGLEQLSNKEKEVENREQKEKETENDLANLVEQVGENLDSWKE